ncbi:50S ribosomal protein L24 [Candidatus Dojkabacteria bacterium]|jgi:large subunit ribosomal protein L24|uniref:Large ribosomal subunit protein uL24 n=1 Tax=Candidatus Dojkabacteria bacterium TaxID=2099670 RepID=A0A847EU04_9BACT|nr:50S ribosomal protein L24 [Candidatus Dojkabacteria bacterium]
MKIKKGDNVKILYGKDNGKQGVVLAISNGKVIVEGLNMFKKHVKGDGKEKKSEILTIAKPLDISKLMLVCPSCGKPTRVSLKRENGKVERVCKKCGKVIEVVVKEKEEKKVEKKTEKKTEKKVVNKSTVKKVSKPKSKTKKE